MGAGRYRLVSQGNRRFRIVLARPANPGYMPSASGTAARAGLFLELFGAGLPGPRPP